VKPNRIAAHFGLLTVSFLYGINYSILKQVTPEYIEPFGFIVYRVGFAALILWGLNIGNKEQIDWKTDRFRIILCAIFGVSVNQLLFFKGISLTTAINGSIIMTLIPIFVFGLSVFLLKEKITFIKLLGLLVGFGGAVLILYQPGTGYIVGNWIGDLLIVFNGLSYSIYLVIVKPLMRKYSALTVTRWIFSIGFFLVLPVGFAEAITIEPGKFPVNIWWSIAFVIIAVTVIVYFLNAWAMRLVSPTLVGIYAYLQPVFATSVAVFFFNESLEWIHIVSALLIFSGIYLVGKK
jgi:drug/metabolite transporter (DMT)-like permease